MTTITLRETLDIAEKVHTELPRRTAADVAATADKDSVQNIGGFPVVDTMLVDDRLRKAQEKHNLAIEQYKADREALIDKTIALGVGHLAVVPTAYWKNICERHGLITVTPSLRGGSIPINTSVPYTLTENAKRPWDVASKVLVSLAILSLGVVWTGVLVGVTITSRVSAFMAVMIASTAILSAASFIAHRVGIYRGDKAVRDHLIATPYSTLLQDVVRSGRNYFWSINDARVILPPPPSDVVNMLRKLRDARHQFSVTAAPEALKLDPSVDQIYLRGHATETQRMIQEDRDPIITIEFGAATAVLAQFGEFAWEKKVVEEVIMDTPLPVYNHDWD